MNSSVSASSTSTSDDGSGSFFDTRLVFEQWLKLVGAEVSGTATSEPAEHDETEIHLEAQAGSDCEVTFAGVLSVDGPLRRNIRSADGTLVITQQGRVEADIDVRIALIDGYFDGHLRATEQVVLERNARVAGNIRTPSLVVRDGAVFEGNSFVLARTSANVLSEICETPSNAELTKATAAGA